MRKAQVSVKQVISDTIRQRIDAAIAAGCRTSSEIGKGIGVSTTTAWRYLKRLGYRPNTRGWSPQKKKGDKSNAG